MDFAELLRQKREEEEKQSQQTQGGGESFADVLRQKKAEEDGAVQDRAREAAGKAVNALTGGFGKVKKAFAVGSGGTPISTPPTQQNTSVPPGLPEPTIYEQRKARQQAASAEAKDSWWDLLGKASQASQMAQSGQMLSAEQGRELLAAGARLSAAMQENREANKVIDWEGRKELLNEYRTLIGDPGRQVEAARVREQLRQGDIKAGNLAEGGDMSYSVEDWAGNLQEGAGETIASTLHNAIWTGVDASAKGPAMPAELVVGLLSGKDVDSINQQRQDRYESPEFRKFMADRYAEADAIYERAQKNLKAAKENQAPVIQAGVDIGENIIELGADVAIAKLTGGSSLAPMAVRVFGQSSMEARHRGASLDQQVVYGAANAAIELVTESISGLGGRGMGRGWTDAATTRLINRMSSSKWGRFGLRVLFAGFEEGGEEFIADLLHPLSEKAAGMEVTPWDIEQMIYDYFIGAAVGIMSAGGRGSVNLAAEGDVFSDVGSEGRTAESQEQGTVENGQNSSEQFTRPEIKATPKNEVQKRIVRLLDAAKSKADMARVLEFISDEPELAQSFKDLTGVEAEAQLMSLISETVNAQQPNTNDQDATVPTSEAQPDQAPAQPVQEAQPYTPTDALTGVKPPKRRVNVKVKGSQQNAPAAAPVQQAHPQQRPTAPANWDEARRNQYLNDHPEAAANAYGAADTSVNEGQSAPEQGSAENRAERTEKSLSDRIREDPNYTSEEKQWAIWRLNNLDKGETEADILKMLDDRAYDRTHANSIETGRRVHSEARSWLGKWYDSDAANRRFRYDDARNYLAFCIFRESGYVDKRQTPRGRTTYANRRYGDLFDLRRAQSFASQHENEASEIEQYVESKYGPELREATRGESVPASTQTASRGDSDAFNSGSEVSDVRETPDARSAVDFLIDNDSAPEQHEAYEVVGAGRDGVYRRKVNSATRGENRSGTVRTENPEDFYRTNDVRNTLGIEEARRHYAADAEIENRRRANKGLSQEQRDSAKKEASKAELVRVAREQIKADFRNRSRIQDGVDEWASVSAYDRAGILNEVTGDDYYVSGGTHESGTGEVVRAQRSVKSDTDQRSSDFYSAEMKEAGIEDVSGAQLREGDAIARAEAKGKIYKDEDAPADHVGTRPNGYSQRELAGRARDARQRELYNKRQGREKAREKEFGGKAVENKVLGKPNTELQSKFLQRIMRDEARLKDLINGDGEFSDANDKAFGIGARFDMLRAMYPDANFYIDTNTNSIRIAGTEGRFTKAEREAAAQFGFTPEQLKQNQQAADDRKRGVDQANLERLQANLENGGTENEIPRPPQESSSRTFGRGRVTTAQALFRSVFKAYNRYRTDNLRLDRNARAGRGEPAGNQRGNEKRNTGATPVLKTKAELDEYGGILKVAESKGWGLIGSLTQSMADANKLANRFDTPLIHASNLNSGSNSGGFAGKHMAALAWGKKASNQAAHLVHEITHVLTARKFGKHGAGNKFLLSAFKNSSLGADGMKAVGRVYRDLYQDDYAKSSFGKPYSKLDVEQRREVDDRIGAEIFNDVISNNASKFAESGFFGKDLFPAFSEFRQRCFEAAIKGGLYTNEDLGVLDEFLEKGLVDDFAEEVAEEQKNREGQLAEYDRQVSEYAENSPQPDDAASPLFDPKAPSARTETVEGEEPDMAYWRRLGEGAFNEREDKRRARVEEDYRPSKGEDKEAQQRWYKEHPQDVSDVREPQYARQLNREYQDQQLLAERDLDRGGVDVDAEDFDDVPPAKPAPAPAPTEDRTERIPESSAEYIQQNRLTKDDFERREAEREGMEAEHKAEEAQIRQEIAQDDAYRQHADDVAALEDVKKQYGEKVHGKLTELSKKLSGLVGQKRLQGSGNNKIGGQVREAITYNRGGKFIEGFANAFDSFTKGKSTFKDFANAYLDLNSAKQESKGSYFYDETFGKQMEKLRDAYEEGGRDVFDGKGRLRPKFARRVETLASMITHRVELQQKSLDFREELNSMFEGMSEEELRERKTALEKLLQTVEQMQLRPSTAFKWMANFDHKNGAAWYKLADMTRDATKAYINTYQFAQNYFQEVTERKDWRKFSEGKIKVKNVIPGLNYDKLSANMAVSFLKTLETDGAMEHIALNGLVEMAATEGEYYSDKNNKGFGDNGHHSQMFDPISTETREAIENAKAHNNDYDLDQAMQRAYDELETVKRNLRKEVEGCKVAKAAYDASFAPIDFLKRALNKTSRVVWGSDVATQNKYYWSLLAGGPDSARELLNDHSYGLNEMRIVQERTGGRGGLRIMAFTDMMQDYMQYAAHWSSYQQLSDTLQMLSRPFAEGEVNSNGFGPMSSITQTLQNKYGQAWADWLSNYEDDLNGKRGDKTDKASRFFRGLRSNVAQSSLVMNGSVALKQAPSMLDFMGVLDADIVAKRFATGFWQSKKHFKNNALIQTMEGYTHILESREDGAAEEGKATDVQRKNLASRIVSKLPKWMTNWISKTDYRTVANGMLACADQVDRWIDKKKPDYGGLKKGSDAYYQAVADLFENAVMDTQPIYNKEYRADAMRTNNELIRSLSMFSTQQTQNYNNLIESYGEYQAAKRNGSEEEIKAARARFASTVTGQVASQIMFAFLDGAAKVLLHKRKQYEDEDGNFDWGTFAAKNGYTFLNSVLSTSWLGRQLSPVTMDAVTALLNKKTNGKVPASGLYFGTEEAALSLIGDFFTAIKDFSEDSDAAAVKNLVFATSSLFGHPTRNVYNMLNTVVMHSLDFDWGSSVGLDKLLGIEDLPSLKGVNASNEDDFLGMLQRYYSAKPNTRGKLAVQKAIAMMNAGNDWGKDAILSTLDKSDKNLVSAAKSELKTQFLAGKIDVSDYRDILHTYFHMSNKEINPLIDAAQEARRFNAITANIDGFEAADKRLSDFSWTNDRTGDRRMNEIVRFDIPDAQKDVMVQHYMGSKYYDNYSVLRSAGLSPSKAHSVLNGIDTDGDSYGLSQDELWQRYKDRPRQEDYIELLWNSMGYKGDYTKDWETYKARQISKGK